MKKMLVLAAVALATTSAYASKARLTALQGAAHIIDTRNVLPKPDQALTHGEFATFELSANAAGNNDQAPAAEGGFVRKIGNGALGAYLGNKGGLAHSSLGLLNDYSYKIQNPLNLFYANKMGDYTWGLGLQYANTETKASKQKSSVMGLTLGANGSNWDAQLALGLTGEASNSETQKLEQKSPMSLNAFYTLVDSLSIYAGYEMLGAKLKNSGTVATDTDKSTIKLGVINSHKKDGAEFFYGAELQSITTKIKDGDKTETTALPLIMGVEADATSWLVMRASLTQTLLLGTTKTTPATGASSETTLTDNTKAAAGLGLKLGKFMVDGTLAATNANTTSGKLGTDNNFLADLGVTYKF